MTQKTRDKTPCFLYTTTVMSFLDSYSNVHCIGAGGIGVSAVCKFLKFQGKQVAGSDVKQNEAVQELIDTGIQVSIGHRAENVADETDLIIYSSAVPHTNPERQKAKERGIKEMEYFEFLGQLSKERKTLCVSGTNGKSTTTALLGLMLEAAGFDPTVVVGVKVPNFPEKNLRLGKSEWLVVEACEHMAHMLLFHPHGIVLTNIEEDHLDFYRDINHIHETFQEYVSKLPATGVLVRNVEDERCMSLKTEARSVAFSAVFGDAEYRAVEHSVGDGVQNFNIQKGETKLGVIALHVPGEFNVANALAAASMALEVGVPFQIIQKVLNEFQGVWRRFQKVGTYNGAQLISDYGHHPTAVSVTLAGARSFYPNKRIVLAFQPHHRHRTKELFSEFVASFDLADVVILQEIYDVAGREGGIDVSSSQLVKAVQDRDQETGRAPRIVEFAADQHAVEQWIRQHTNENDVVLLMGAGDLYKVADKLV